MKCSICGLPIVLIPSAAERAKKFGGTAQQYIDLFPYHSSCYIEKRSAESRELMRRIVQTAREREVRIV